MTFDLVTVLLVGVAAGAAGYRLGGAVVSHRILAILSEAEAARGGAVLKTESIDNVLYFYDEAGNFVCQGDDIHAAAANYGLVAGGGAAVIVDNGGVARLRFKDGKAEIIS